MRLGKLTAALMGLVLLAGCKKEPIKPTPAPAPAEENPRVAIKLNSGYLPAGKVDSAVLVWEINGQLQQATMQLSNDTLFTETKNLTRGAGRLTVQLFSQTTLRQQNLQWEKRTELTLREKESVNWPAPTGYDDAAWFPRVILIDAPSTFTAIVALRPADPYFFLKNIPAGFKIELERHYTRIPGGAEIVGGGLWKCNTVCTDARGIIENRQYFSNLPAQMAGREWKMVEIGIGLFGNNSTSGPGFYFNHY
jgi:hypothetical protein